MILVRKTLQVKMENRVSGFGYKAEELGHSQMSIIIKRERERTQNFFGTLQRDEVLQLWL